MALQRLTAYQQALINKGTAPDQAVKIANGLLNKSIALQSQLKFSVDYYHWISWLVLATILVIALFPSVGQVDIKVNENQPAAVAF